LRVRPVYEEVVDHGWNVAEGVNLLARPRLCLISEDMDYVSNNEEAFDTLFRREYPAIVRTAYGVLGDRQGAEDVAQEAFVRLYARWPQVRSYDRPGAWVRRVAIRVAVRQRGRTARQGDHGSGIVAPPETASLDVDLLRALSSISPMQRAVVVLHYLHDLPVAEAAAELGCRETTARVHLHRARSRLAALLREDEVAR